MGKRLKPDYYKILGITVKANDKQIKNAAIKMLHKYRPDVYKKGDANLKSEEIIEARDCLLDFDKRKKYDRYWLDNYGHKEETNSDLQAINDRKKEPKFNDAVNDDLSMNKMRVNTRGEVQRTKVGAFFHKLQLPERSVDKEYPFLFKVYNWKTDGMIFIVTAIIIPMIALFALAFGAEMGQRYRGWDAFAPKISMQGDDAAPMIFFAINIISNLVGFIIFWQRDSKVLTKSGFITFYSYVFITGIVSIIVSLVLSPIKAWGYKDVFNGRDASGKEIVKSVPREISDMPAFLIASLWFEIVAEAIIVWLAFWKTKNLKQRILKTLKENWKMWIIVALITGGLVFVFSSIVMPDIFTGVDAVTLTSNNEHSLESALGDPHVSTGFKVGYAITLFILSILIAPITEELATRLAIFTGVSNKGLAIVIAALYFAMLHCESGDVEHMLNYFIGGLFLSGIFAIARGNVTYDSGAHVVNNVIAFIIICTKIH